MKELEQILRSHAVRYPRMQPEDAVKLIYQNEFGGGHLIRDEAAFRRYLAREYAATARDLTREKYEPLGNGILRVYLAALEPEDLEPLAEAFLQSAAQHRGDLSSFLQKLELLKKLTGEGIFCFAPAALEDYLTAYAAAGYPMVSHSNIYRETYRPAYRIIAERYRETETYLRD